jgi:hypothetical protein
VAEHSLTLAQTVVEVVVQVVVTAVRIVGNLFPLVEVLVHQGKVIPVVQVSHKIQRKVVAAAVVLVLLVEVQAVLQVEQVV